VQCHYSLIEQQTAQFTHKQEAMVKLEFGRFSGSELQNLLNWAAEFG